MRHLRPWLRAGTAAAAHLTDHVLTHLPVRQWVLSVL